jgi:hypothetical protein
MRGKSYGGRSINLAMSERGLNALKAVGLEEKLKEFIIPMPGRLVHTLQGNFRKLKYRGEYFPIIQLKRRLGNLFSWQR